MKNKEENMDVLKVICTLFVVMVHVCGPFCGRGSGVPGSSTFMIGSSIQIFTRVAVPIFVLISGKYILGSWDEKSLGGFYKKRYGRIILPLLFSIVVYGVYRIFGEKSADISSYLKDAVMGKTYGHLWYLYMLLGMYAFTPILYKIKNKVSHKAFRNIGFLLLITAMVTQLGEEMTGFKVPVLQFIDYVGFYITGYTLKDYKPKNKNMLFGMYLFLAALGSGLAIFLQAKGIMFWMIIHMGNNVIATPAAIYLYLFFNNITIENSKIAQLGKYTFGVYIVHNMFVSSILAITNGAITGIDIVDILIYWAVSAILSFVVIKILWCTKLTRKLVA